MMSTAHAEKNAPETAMLTDEPVSRRPITVAEGMRWILAIVSYPKDSKEWGRISPAARSLGVLIRERYARQQGYARFSLEHAEAVLGYSRASLSAGVRDLVRAGFIERIRENRRSSNEYIMRFDIVDEVEQYVAGARLQLKARQWKRAAERRARATAALKPD